MSGPIKIIFSLGSSLREENQFIELLKKFGIKVLVDVRRFPKSRLPHFCQERLFSKLDESQIKYFYLGDQLGGFRSGGYEHFTQSSEFQTGLDKLKSIGKKNKTAFMCAEKFPSRCHRRFIAERLQEHGWKVIHILDEDRTWEAKRKTKKQEPMNMSLDI